MIHTISLRDQDDRVDLGVGFVLLKTRRTGLVKVEDDDGFIGSNWWREGCCAV